MPRSLGARWRTSFARRPPGASAASPCKRPAATIASRRRQVGPTRKASLAPHTSRTIIARAMAKKEADGLNNLALSTCLKTQQAPRPWRRAASAAAATGRCSPAFGRLAETRRTGRTSMAMVARSMRPTAGALEAGSPALVGTRSGALLQRMLGRARFRLLRRAAFAAAEATAPQAKVPKPCRPRQVRRTSSTCVILGTGAYVSDHGQTRRPRWRTTSL
mmetsp:Transcript_45200/g.137040  ORF Transcript_45200/g.137040 Transcript_45200/m.137040 type:complete len:219 (-) Transcript_45200:513-1169(-)